MAFSSLSVRALFNRNIPLISGKYGLRNHFRPLESGFSHEQKWEKVWKRGLKQWNPPYAILYVNTISKQLSDQIFIEKLPRNKLLSYLERLDWPNCSHWSTSQKTCQSLQKRVRREIDNCPTVPWRIQNILRGVAPAQFGSIARQGGRWQWRWQCLIIVRAWRR